MPTVEHKIKAILKHLETVSYNALPGKNAMVSNACQIKLYTSITKSLQMKGLTEKYERITY